MIPPADPRRLPGAAWGRSDARPGRTPTSPTARVGEREQHAVPRVQALGPRRRHLHAADRPLAARDCPERRAGAATGASDRHHGDVCGRRGGGVPDGGWRRTDSAPGGTQSHPGVRGDAIEREALFWEHEGNRAIRVGNWKLVAKADQPWELYDLSVDRTELRDLAASELERVQNLSSRWDAWATPRERAATGNVEEIARRAGVMVTARRSC